MVTEEGLIHCRQARLVKDVMDEPEWISNLKPGRPPVDWGRDELASLRREAGVTPKVPATKVRSSSSSSKKGKRRRDRSSGDSKKDSKSRKKTCQKDAIQEPKALFEGTGLDPKDRVRRHFRQKAMKLVRKRTSKKEEASGSSSSGSQSGKTDHEELGELFGESVKARLVADRFPGILAMESLVAMRSSLLQEAGETEDQVALKPTALLYYRGNLSKKTSGPQGREVLTHCTVVDYLLRRSGSRSPRLDPSAGQIDRSNCEWNALHYSSASRASPPRESTSHPPGGVEKCNPRVLCRQQDEVVVHSPRWPAWKRQGERWEEPGSQGGQGPQRRRQEGRSEEEIADVGGEEFAALQPCMLVWHRRSTLKWIRCLSLAVRGFAALRSPALLVWHRRGTLKCIRCLSLAVRGFAALRSTAGVASARDFEMHSVLEFEDEDDRLGKGPLLCHREDPFLDFFEPGASRPSEAQKGETIGVSRVTGNTLGGGS